MRGKVSIVLIVGLVVCLCGLTTMAQDEGQEAQAYFILTVLVKPSEIVKYEAAVKEMVALNSQHNAPYPWFAFQADDMEYHFFTPVKNLADVDNMYKVDEELGKKMPEEKIKKIEELMAGTYEYTNTYMLYQIPELSYVPENPRITFEEAFFRQLLYYNIQPDKEKEFYEIMKEFLTLYKSKNVTEGYEIFTAGMGLDQPTCIVSLKGKSAADFEVHLEKMWGVLGEEGLALVQKLIGLARGLNIKTAWFRPDLSYMPVVN